MNTIHGMSDNSENIIPILPADDGIIIKKPDIAPNMPIDFLNLGLLINMYANNSRQMVLST